MMGQAPGRRVRLATVVCGALEPAHVTLWINGGGS